MRKASILFLIGILPFNLFGQIKNNIVEVVVYTVKPNADLNYISHKINHEMTTFNGFVSRQTFQSVKKPNVLLDWVTWESLEHAENAAQEFQHHEKFTPFMEVIDTVNFFEHFQLEYLAGSVSSFDTDCILELVVYKIKENKLNEVGATFTQVSKELKDIEGFKGRQTGISLKDESTFVDFLLWEDLEKAQNSMKIVEKNPKILPFFEMNDTTFIFEHFTLIN